MKKLALFMLVAVAIAMGCRKKVLRDVDSNIVDQHCTNYAMDADEHGLDCGGLDCEACDQTLVPCTLDTNKIHAFLSSGIFQHLTFINCEMDTVSDTDWRFGAYTSSTEYLYLRFPGKPNVETVYTGTADGLSLQDYEVYVQYYQDFPDNDLIGTGDIYVNYENNHYTISSCDFGFHPSGSFVPTTIQSFSFTF